MPLYSLQIDRTYTFRQTLWVEAESESAAIRTAMTTKISGLVAAMCFTEGERWIPAIVECKVAKKGRRKSA